MVRYHVDIGVSEYSQFESHTKPKPSRAKGGHLHHHWRLNVQRGMSDVGWMPLSRRHLLASTTAAAFAFLHGRTHAQDNPAANVADRASAIRLTKLTALPCGTKAFLKLETSMALTGWGEITGLDPKVACALAESLWELLDGENPTRIEHLWQKIFRSHRDMRGGPFMTHVLSAIDMALWDITGRLHGVPVFRLLGGPVRDRIRVYPTAKAYKIGTGGPHEWAESPQQIERFVKMVTDARAKVGPDGVVMFDAHSALPPPALIQFANAIQPQDVAFIEEPAVPGDIQVFKRIKEAVRVPLATGERDRTIWGVLPYLTERCIDILQPDVGHTGGITQMKKIATLAEAFNIPLAPHSIMTEVGVAASLHVCASIPNFFIQESRLADRVMPEGVLVPSFNPNADGHATLPEGPGLGVEVNEPRLREFAANPKQKFSWPKPKAKDGAVIDY
jgi:galactonate dehydratase